MSFQPLDSKTSTQKVAIVTGANSGIGYEVAKYLALNGFHVIVACRSRARADKAMSDMRRESADEASFRGVTLQLDFMALDLASLRSCVAFTEQFKAKHRHLHVLVCNAGIVMAPYGQTEDNFEKHFQVNYLSHLLITLHLLPLMLATPTDDVRIVMVSSILHQRGSFNLENIQGNQSYNRRKFYSNSKLYQVMLGLLMGRRLEGTKVTISSANPGGVKTNAGQSFGDSKLYSFIFSMMGKMGILLTSVQGAANILEPIVNPDRKGANGLYYDSQKPKTPSSAARNEPHQEALWRYSLECLKGFIDNDLLISAGMVSSTEQGAMTDFMY